MYGKPARFNISEIDIIDELTKDQEEQIDALTRMSDFNEANFNAPGTTITFTGDGFEEYDAFLAFLKKLVNIIPTLVAFIEVTDTDDDSYWTIWIESGKIEECFATVIWNTAKDKQRIRKVLEAHIEPEDETIYDEMVDQILRALAGEYDDEDENNESTEDESRAIINVPEKDEEDDDENSNKRNNKSK